MSPSQVHLDRVSSDVLKDLFNTGTCSHNMLLQKETNSEERRPKRVQRVSTATQRGGHRRTLEPLVTSGLGIGCRDARHTQSVFSCFSTSSTRQMNCIAVQGSIIRLSPCPKNSCPAASRGTKLPQLYRGCPAGRDGENSVKKLCILTAIKPSNVEKERVRFFKSDFNYNPQFEYSNPVSAQVLARHSNASDCFLPQVRLCLKRYAWLIKHFVL